MLSSRFKVIFKVNNKVTYTLENVVLSEVWDESIPSEALRPSNGNRWHVLMKYAANQKMASMQLGDTIDLAYQDYIEGHDNEEISVVRIL